MSRINYDLKKIRGIAFDIDGVLSPDVVPLGVNGLPNRMVSLKDGFAIQLAVRSGLAVAIISGARPSGIEKRFADLGVPTVIMHAGDKEEIFRRWMVDNGLTADEVAYSGDDIPDCGPMSVAGLKVAPADACTDIMLMANYISPCKGDMAWLVI